jgi:hypothetical protein
MRGDSATTGEKALLTPLDEAYRAFAGVDPEARELDFHVASLSRFVPAAPVGRTRTSTWRETGRWISTMSRDAVGPRAGLELHDPERWDGRARVAREAIEPGGSARGAASTGRSTSGATCCS